MAPNRKRSPEQAWCDGVLALASQLRGSQEQIAEALLATVFFRAAEMRGLLPDTAPFEKRYVWLAERGGDVSMLPALTPAFTEVPVEAKDDRFGKVLHIDVLGELHCRLMSGDERQGRGSFYTPREMAAQIVARTIEPLLYCPGPAESKDPPETWKLKSAAEIANLKICDPSMGSGVFLVEAIRYLGDALHRAMEREGKSLSLHDCRIAVALRCIYGVDKDPAACWLAQCVVWLFLEEPTLSRYALLHALRCGDALVGLDPEQLCSFHWEHGHPAIPEIVRRVTSRMEVATHLRERFRSCRLSDDDALELSRKLDVALDDVRFIGNLCIGAFFACSKPKERESERKRRLGLVLAWLRADDGPTEELVQMHETFVSKQTPFHWHAEFPEAFLWGDSTSLIQRQLQPPSLSPTVIGADPVAVQAVQNANGQMGWAL